MKSKFVLVLAADYQMSKLVPYWGLSPQPGSTYYLQKLTHDIYGIVNHATNVSAVYVFDERVGPKNTDHTISFTTHYISNLPDWVRQVHLFLDNTCSTNKKLLPDGLGMGNGCTRPFGPPQNFIPHCWTYLLFSKIAKTYNARDVFSTTELKDDVIAHYADITEDDGSIVHVWREPLATKYSKMPGIRSLHDCFLQTPCDR